MNGQPLPPQLLAALQQDDVTFWSERFRDHAALLYILIDPARANDLKTRSHQELQNWTLLLQNINFEILQQLITTLSVLKHQVLERSRQGQINLMLTHQDFMTLVEHMIKELNFFITSRNGQLSPQKELDFWIRESAEHTELSAHLLPAGQLQSQTLYLAQQLQMLLNMANANHIISVYEDANQAAIRLDQMIQQANPDARNNLIHMMLEHEIKEALRGDMKIRQILGLDPSDF